MTVAEIIRDRIERVAIDDALSVVPAIRTRPNEDFEAVHVGNLFDLAAEIALVERDVVAGHQYNTEDGINPRYDDWMRSLHSAMIREHSI